MAPKRRKLGEAFSFTALSYEATDEMGPVPSPSPALDGHSRPGQDKAMAAREPDDPIEGSSQASTTRDSSEQHEAEKTARSRAGAAPSPNPSTSPSTGPSRAGVSVSDSNETASLAPRTRTRRSTRPPAARRGRDGAAQAAREGATNIPIARILYLPEDLIEPIRVYRATNNITNTQLALRALNATYRQIPDLIAAQHQPKIVSGDLFDEVITAPAKSNRQVEITPTAAQLDTIDPLVQSTGANDRSHLFAVAIRQFLTDAGLLQS